MRQTSRLLCLIASLLAAGAAILCAQQYPFVPVAGSPKGITNLFQDSRGRLWLGGPQLACFDGSRVYFLRDYGFTGGETYDVEEDSSGAIWIAAESGVYRFGEGRIREIAKGVAVSVVPASPDVAVALVGPLGRGLPVNASSLLRIERTGDGWKVETASSLESPGPLTLDHQGRLLYPAVAGGWNELPLRDVAGWHPGLKLSPRHNPVPGLPGAGPTRFQRDRAGCVWMGADGSDVYNCGGEWRTAPYDTSGVRSNFREAPDGSMVLVGYNMLAVGRPGAFRVATLANGLPVLLSAIQARDGTLWLGGTEGLYRFASPFRLEFWTAREGVDSPWCLQRLANDLFAGLDRVVARLSPDRHRWNPLASFAPGRVMNLLPAGAASMLVALNPGSVSMIDRSGTVVARTDPKYDDGYALRFAEAAGGEFWLGGIGLGNMTRKGRLLKFATHYLQTQPAGNVLDVQYEPQTRKLWACYNGGLTGRDDNGTWREFNKKDGLLVDPCWSLAALPNGDVWYGYYNTPAFALLRPAAGGRMSVRQFRAGGDIVDPESITFDADRRGWLWRGGNHGMSVAGPRDAENGNWIHLDQADGLPADAVNSGSFFADTDGSLWWGADNNVVHYTPPDRLVAPEFAPQVFIASYSWDNSPPRLAEASVSPPHGARVTAHIGTLQFDRRAALRLRYRVLPGDMEWHETRSLDVSLGSQTAGPHTLEVQAKLFTGPWSPAVRRPFTVLQPAWLGWPFLSAYLLAFTGLAGGSYWIYRRREAEDATLLPDLAAWRMGALLPEVHALTGAFLDSRFEVGELLARGGFANVFAGFDRSQRCRCAVKVFRGEVKDKEWVQRRFEQEVAALEKVRHPHVVAIYAHGAAASGAPYLVMEFVAGPNLREVLERGPLGRQRTAHFLGQLAGALDAIHAQGICHRDLKPENIIVREEGSPDERAILIDFSIAIVKDADETLYGLSRAAGSFDYMAPEQAVGYADTSSDIYSLAKLAIEMLTGRRLKELLPDAALDLPDRVRDLLPGVDGRLSAESIRMMAAALEFDPSRRPHAAGSFAAPLVRDLQS